MPISSRSKADYFTGGEDDGLRPAAPPGSLILCGRIVGVFGIRGALKVLSQTDPPEGLLSYRPWWLGSPGSETPVSPVGGRLLRRSQLMVLLPGIRDRDQAQGYAGVDVAVERRLFPDPAPGQFYWADLVGLAVEDLGGRVRGTVREIVRGPSGDVLDIQGDEPLLMPFLWQKTVVAVDLAHGWIRVAWPERF
ncbi:16S rRNA processing protein RimM [mine drainage metagenome]|uniref:16S rRNA processing protein RimM n=1 Tax=mine drainage metagenome TaxID=410659 RepID=T1BZ74_9ZZZZ